ncbi:RNA ligase [Rhizoctonia solani]|uniref:RNA ligase n=1 Tax=Rhizoctonia solani TaxID=456999 RepID=A0A8H7ICQ1_9AGAM|nr:RNA ligase [Rhizoctonia solani]
MAPSRYEGRESDDIKDDVDEVKIDKLNLSDTDEVIPPSQPDDSALIRQLRSLAKKQPKLIRGKKYTIAGQSIELTSWKMTEWMYTKSPCPFPTLARGLFTRWVPARGHENDPEGAPGAGKDQIVVRGYDKFFNMNEVKWNTWEALEIHTTSPYTLTLKSNGCIIFMAALTPTELIVTSKHALGDIEGASCGKTRKDFAKTLFDRNLTAVAELCDDSFEEHVLPYPKDKTGLHLHGLNERRVEFSTLGNDEVVAFAEEWGFIATPAITFDTIEEVKKFTDSIAKTGTWHGEAVEGFVVRTAVSDRPPALVQAYRGTRGERITDKKEQSTPPPYSPGSTFFFKIKFEEPYLMYREWRELTKKMLAAENKGQLRAAQLPSHMLRRPETRAYHHWVEDQIRHNPKSLAGFNEGHGIIAARERFLECLENGIPYNGSHKTILVPVAIPGSGKTAVAVALQHIYGFGHTQSDDVKQKKTGPQFVKNVLELFRNHDVVFADRNNHLRHLRDSLKYDFKGKYRDKGHIIALQWLVVTIINPCTQINKRVRGVISQFFNSFEEVEAEEVDDIIDMEYTDTLEQAVKRAISGISPILDLEIPDDKKINEACAIARSYTVKSTGAKKAAPKPPRYFALVPDINVEKLIGNYFEEEDAPDSGAKMWSDLVSNKRVADRPHVTLIHVKEKQDSVSLWERCLALQKSAGEIEPTFRVTFNNIIWNNDVMALSVSRIEMHREFEDVHRQLAEEVVETIPESITNRLHLTIGTRDDSINPFEAASMVADWKRGVNSSAQSVLLRECVVEAKFLGRYS